MRVRFGGVVDTADSPKFQLFLRVFHLQYEYLIISKYAYLLWMKFTSTLLHLNS